MKIKFLVFGVIASLCFVSCIDNDDDDGIGGSTDLETNEIGYTYTLNGAANGVAVGNGFEATVINKTGDIIEVELEGKIANPFISQLPSIYVGSNGNVKISGNFINSTEGVAYVNANGEQSVLVKYDAKVGDKWSYTTLGGKKITREVKSVSTDDDYFWAGMMIKVIEVEQNLPYPGFTKAVYFANHKFGLVGVQITLEDGNIVYWGAF